MGKRKPGYVEPLRPGFANAHYDLGRVLAKAERIDEAVASLKTSIELYRASAGAAAAWYELGLCYERKTEVELAKEALRKALALAPNDREAATALRRLGGTSGDVHSVRVSNFVQPFVVRIRPRLDDCFKST